MILLIDNYDSFVYNLARYVRELGEECIVKRNDAMTLQDIETWKPSHIIISPGPCGPLQTGICREVIQRYASSIPILGVCLGHQTIGHSLGAKVTRARFPRHGKASLIHHEGTGIFAGLENPFVGARYHSLIISEENFPDDLAITARDPMGEIMAIQHKEYPLFGVQFHPESVLTRQGKELLNNFLVF